MLAHDQIHASFLIQIKHRVLYIYKFMEISRQAVELAPPKKSVQTRISSTHSFIVLENKIVKPSLMFQHLKKKQKIGQTLQYSHLILKKK